MDQINTLTETNACLTENGVHHQKKENKQLQEMTKNKIWIQQDISVCTYINLWGDT